MGSSVGVSKATNRIEFDRACSVALGFDEWILAEEAIVGREIELAVLGDDPPTVSVPGEIVPGDEFYSYVDKYEADDDDFTASRPSQAASLRSVRWKVCCRQMTADWARWAFMKFRVVEHRRRLDRHWQSGRTAFDRQLLRIFTRSRPQIWK